MRNIINISVPPAMAREVNRAVKKGNYASKSEFFRHLLRMWQDNQLLGDIHASEQDYRAGNWKTLRSPQDLDR